jgi:hypothetical protein
MAEGEGDRSGGEADAEHRRQGQGNPLTERGAEQVHGPSR